MLDRTPQVCVPTRCRRPVLAVIAALLLASSLAGAEPFKNPKANIPPEAKPQRMNGGEGFPPLPLPATPLRRSERKREPSPPALVGSITFSKKALKGSNVDWKTTIVDIEQWVKWTNKQLGQRYRFVDTSFDQFSYDPAELPILYFTGWQELPRFDDGTIQKLRRYLLDGGTLVVHSNCGRPEFNTSFRREIARIFPDRELAPIPTDHPLFKSFYPITSMHVRKDSDPVKEVPPYLETINIGTRAAVIFSPIDLSCGWNVEKNPIDGGILYTQQDALKLGSNIVTYCLAEYQYGRFFAHQKIYHQSDLATRDQLVLGQIVHNGDWDPTPHGVPNLLKTVDESTTLNVQFKRVPVDLEKDDVFAFPVLLLIGQRDFTLSDAARKRLREYLDNGGVMVVDCAAGSSEFDVAFRKQMKLLYPDKELKLLPPEHPVNTFVFDEKQVKLSPLAAEELPDVHTPQLYAIEREGMLPVIYSPLSLSAGWEQLPRAYNKGYADADALKMGVNLLMYVTTH